MENGDDDKFLFGIMGDNRKSCVYGGGFFDWNGG